MSDLLIYDLDPVIRLELERRAQAHDRNVSDEAQAVLRNVLDLPDTEPGIEGPPPGMGLGTWLYSLTPPEFRVDLDYEMPDVANDPPDFS
jgi:hypothetical protein